MEVLQLVSDTIGYKTIPLTETYKCETPTSSGRRILKIAANSKVTQLDAAMAQLHKKYNFANFTPIFSFELSKQ